MPKSETRVVMVGCGGIAGAWLKAFLPMQDIKLVGMVDLNRQAALKLAAIHQLPVDLIHPSLAEALKAAQPDAVFDMTVPGAHDQVTLQALKAGCHVLGEKPMSDALAKARKMVAAAQKAHRTYAVTQTRRYNPRLRALVNFLRARAIGDLEELHADFYLGPHFGGFRDEMDFPLIIDMAIHTLDAGRWLADADPVSVYCHSFNPKRSWYKGDCSAVIIFEMAKGIVFTYRGSWCAQGVKTSWEAAWRVVGSKGSVTWDGHDAFKAEIARKPKAGEGKFFWDVEEVPVPQVALEHTGHAGAIREFVDCIRKGRKPLNSCEDNIKSLAMVLAAVQSAKTGKRVKVVW